MQNSNHALIETFEYFQMPPQNWNTFISERKEKPLRIPILWGLHESTQGVVDFHGASRLKLERALTYAAEEKCPLIIELGFRFPKWSFPAWMVPWAETEKSSTVPAIAVGLQGSPIEHVEIPSAAKPAFLKSFYGFILEVAKMCSLYAPPHGTVSSIEINLGLYLLDSSWVTPDEMPILFEERYGSIATLNKAYGTGFRDFKFLSQEKGVHALLDRRPWLGAFDFRWAQKRKLTEIERGAVSCLEGLKIPVEIKRSHSEPKIADILVESGLFHDYDGQFLPFILGDFLHPALQDAFQKYDCLQAELKGASLSMHSLNNGRFNSSRPCAVFSGRYMSRAEYDFIKREITSGAQVLFASEMPKLDEKLEGLQWPNKYKKRVLSQTKCVLLEYEWGLGKFWIDAAIGKAPLQIKECLSELRE